MTSYETTVAELAPFALPSLLDWRRSLYRERYTYEKLSVQLWIEIFDLDREIGPLKKKGKLDEADEKIVRRRRLQGQLESVTQSSHGRNIMLKKLDKSLDEGITVYAPQSCHALCRKMLTTLPPELRDMVYSHLLDTPTLKLLACRARCQLGANQSDANLGNTLPHFLTPSYVPPQFLYELVSAAADDYVRQGMNKHKDYDFRSLDKFLEPLKLDSELGSGRGVLISRFFGTCKVRLHLRKEHGKWKVRPNFHRVGFIQHLSRLLDSIPPGGGSRRLLLEICLAELGTYDRHRFKVGLQPALKDLEGRWHGALTVSWSERNNLAYTNASQTCECGFWKKFSHPPEDDDSLILWSRLI